jgi:hypothetical protein
MPTFAELRVPPPKSWDEFEAIVCSAAKNRWKSADFSQHGRQGQRQDGVDVFGKDDRGRLVGLQCKNTWAGLSQNTIADEIEKAQSFKPQLEQLYVVTTADTDKNLQAFVRELSEQRLKEGRFEVAVLFWNDVWRDLTLDESRLFQHYPQLKPREADGGQPSHDEALFQELQKTFGFEPAVRLLRDHDFEGSFRRKSLRPLYEFVATWDQPEKEFIDKDLQAELKKLYDAASSLVTHIDGKTVPVGADGELASVFSDSLRAAGPRPDWVRDDARSLNEQAGLFVPIYENFVRLCREKLFSIASR